MKRFFAAFLLLSLFNAHPAAAQDSAYDRVMKTKTLRCGYTLYEPFVIKDPNTGKLSGITVDYVNAVAAGQGLKVDWAGEASVDQWAGALDAGRFDAICVPSSPDDVRGKAMDFSAGVGALPYYVYVPQSSTITPEQLETAKFTVVDDYALTDVTKLKFPNAQYSSLPQSVSTAEMYDQLRTGKADAHVNENISAMNYKKNNPGVIRRFSDTPLMSLKMFLITPRGDEKMKSLMAENFDADIPRNLKLLTVLRDSYGVSPDALLLGGQCGKSVVTEKSWRVCADR